ncbi:RES family NAD+ phosphorylase [Ovoidimarina sediminis]|uniref:RES family NAD+ phosphorylase n=1 Tax=Ovoidimarina sediminis TaxID=3079856 RepID=UPI00290CF879|nr:RES family NAD+ phosphorylase [Rhodophyticola sp. MJ-SS7]MDU8942067.1 RES family NAD+ phosphorylase [Rhodophyticola sp. MJ-SS7]
MVSGRFYRAVRPEMVDHALSAPAPESAGRYHAPGEPAIYMSPKLDWARIAVSGYMREEKSNRLIVAVDLDAAWIVDQRDWAACAALGIDPDESNLPWRTALAEGRTPPSWHAAERARLGGADGLIDRSRHIPGGWHVVLFRWNAPGAPRLVSRGPVAMAAPKLDGPKWG